MSEPQSVNAWKRGMERIAPGLYVDAEEALHIDAGEYLEANGYAVTRENEATLFEAFRNIEPKVLRKAFAACLRELRKERHINQERLAYESHVDRSYLAELERALSTPSLETIYKLLLSLKMTFAQFAYRYDQHLRQERRKERNDEHDSKNAAD